MIAKYFWDYTKKSAGYSFTRSVYFKISLNTKKINKWKLRNKFSWMLKFIKNVWCHCKFRLWHWEMRLLFFILKFKVFKKYDRRLIENDIKINLIKLTEYQTQLLLYMNMSICCHKLSHWTALTKSLKKSDKLKYNLIDVEFDNHCDKARVKTRSGWSATSSF